MSGTAAHPRGLYLVSATQMWERFSYFGMVGLLPLFLSTAARDHGFGWSEAEAVYFLGLYMALTYVSPVIGGWLVDRRLGLQRGMIAGCTLMMAGHFAMAIPGALPTVAASMTGVPFDAVFVAADAQMGALALGPRDAERIYSALAAAGHASAAGLAAWVYGAVSWSFYAAILLLIAGAGLFIPAATVTIGELYPANSPLREGGYSLFYMAVNIGAGLGVLIVGYLGERVGWHVGFTSAGLGLLVGLLVFLARRSGDLGSIGRRPAAAAAGPAARPPLLPAERRRLWAIAMLAPFSIVFWIAYAQIDGMLHLHVYNRTDRFVLGFEIPATWLLSLAAFYVVLLGPVFAWIWLRLEQAGRMPSTAMKFAFGLGATAAAFLLVLVAIAEAAGAADGKGGLQWLVVAYLLLVVGEMCIGPVAYAAVTRWSPPPLASLSIGAWCLSDAVANYGGGVVGGLAEGAGTMTVVAAIAAACVAAALLLALLDRPISGLAGERNPGTPLPRPDQA